jgi:hypothetical protein
VQASISEEVEQAAAGVSCHRLIIVQWLNSGDVATGAQLRDRLIEEESVPKDLITLVICRSRRELIKAIKGVISSTNEDDVPILHIESHGEVDESTDRCYGLGGCDPAGVDGRDGIPWRDLDPLLCQLASKAGTRNLVVLGACKTQDLMVYWQSGHVRIGHDRGLVALYDFKIGGSFLTNSSVAFYSALFVQEETVVEAWARANKLNDLIEDCAPRGHLNLELLEL